MTKRAPAKDAADQPAVTIIISFRERWRFTPQTIASILRHTPGKFALWLLDPGLPDALRDALKPHLDAGDLELVPVTPGQPPNHWRAEIVPRLASPYAVFIDNDVVVTPGWLGALTDCAEESGAGIVCPLYLWGETEQSDVIHMAGGILELTPTGEGVRMTESHGHVGRKISDVPDDLCRQPCGFGEFHCLLMRREVYRAEGMFEPGIATVHEHIHASMRARELGFETWFEPEARVTYLAFAPWQVGELRELRARWDFATAESDLTHFAERWSVIDDDDYRAPIRRFLALHAGHTDVLDPRPGLDARRDQIMSRADLEQTFAGLEWRAFDCGYDVKDVRMLRTVYRFAMVLTDGLYRPCGRPFINHLAGTASVLLFYGCPMPQVLAGLLHAAHTHTPSALARPMIERFVRANPRAKSSLKLAALYAKRSRILNPIELGAAGLAQLPVEIASLFLLDAANEVDMHLSLEVAVSVRGDVLAGTRLSNCQTLLEHVGLPGLAATLRNLGGEFDHARPIPFQDRTKMSFRIHPTAADRRSHSAPSLPAAPERIGENA